MVQISSALLIIKIIIIFLFVNGIQLTEQPQNELSNGTKSHEQNLLYARAREIPRHRRSPQFQQSFIVQGLSRPFCSLFGSNRCSPINAQNQCAAGYRYDYVTRRCRQLFNAK